MDRVKWIWYLSPMRAAKVQASLRNRAVSPEPPLRAQTSRESRGTFRQKARSLAPLNGWACAVKICHDGMLEDPNSLDGAQIQMVKKFNLHMKSLDLWLRWQVVQNSIQLSCDIPTNSRGISRQTHVFLFGSWPCCLLKVKLLEKRWTLFDKQLPVKLVECPYVATIGICSNWKTSKDFKSIWACLMNFHDHYKPRNWFEYYLVTIIYSDNKCKSIEMSIFEHWRNISPSV